MVSQPPHRYLQLHTAQHELDEEAEDAVEHQKCAEEGALGLGGTLAREREQDEDDESSSTAS